MMDDHERQLALQKLRETSETFLTEVREVIEVQAIWKPAPDRWSILECIEHVAIAERGMFHLMTRKLTPFARANDSPGREDGFFTRGTDRSKKLIAPETARPSGRFANLAEAVNTFEANRSHTIAYIESCQEELRRLEVVHPLFGPVTARECLALLTVHPARHAQQVRELRNHPQFPR